MSLEIPDHIIERYGTARAFRAEKRKIVKELRRLMDELRLGAAFLPNGPRGVANIDYELEILRRELSVKNWGR